MLRKIIDALSVGVCEDEKAVNFFRSQGFDVLNNFKDGEIISELLKQGSNEQTYHKLRRLAYIISIEIGGIYFGEKEHFEIPEVYEQFRDYMFYGEKEFSLRGFFNEEASNCIKKGCIELLKVFLEEKKLGCFWEDNRYMDWHIEMMYRFEEE